MECAPNPLHGFVENGATLGPTRHNIDHGERVQELAHGLVPTVFDEIGLDRAHDRVFPLAMGADGNLPSDVGHGWWMSSCTPAKRQPIGSEQPVDGARAQVDDLVTHIIGEIQMMVPLEIADQHHLKSIAFPAISTGIYGYPIKAATRIAVETTRAFVADKPGIEDVIFCCFSEGDLEIYLKVLES